MAAETTTPPGAGPGRAKILKPVFISASIIIFGLLALTIAFSQSAGDQIEEATTSLNSAISDGVGWWYVLVVNVFLAFAI